MATRDLRDPETLGLELRSLTASERISNRNAKPSSVYDSCRYSLEAVPDYPQDESIAVMTAARYREELEARAYEGDRNAISMLERGEPGDEPIP